MITITASFIALLLPGKGQAVGSGDFGVQEADFALRERHFDVMFFELFEDRIVKTTDELSLAMYQRGAPDA